MKKISLKAIFLLFVLDALLYLFFFYSQRVYIESFNQRLWAIGIFAVKPFCELLSGYLLLSFANLLFHIHTQSKGAIRTTVAAVAVLLVTVSVFYTLCYLYAPSLIATFPFDSGKWVSSTKLYFAAGVLLYLSL